MKNFLAALGLATIIIGGIFLLESFGKKQTPDASTVPTPRPVTETQIANHMTWDLYRVVDGNNTIYVLEGTNGHVAITK